MKVLGSNPLISVPTKKRPKRRQKEPHRYLTMQEIERLLATATDAYRPVFYVAVWTGMRQSEVLGLIWGDVKLREGAIELTRQLSRAGKGRPAQRVPIKTDEARTIDLDPELVAYLRFLRDEHERRFGAVRPTDYVFCTESASPLHFRNVGKAFTTAADRAGLNEDGSGSSASTTCAERTPASF